MKQSAFNIQKKDKFLFVLELAEKMKNLTSEKIGGKYGADPIQFTCYGSAVPSITINSISLPYGGQTHKISSGSREEYPNLSIDFMVDNGWKNYFTLFSWLNLLNEQKKSFSDFDEYPELRDNPNARNLDPFRNLISNAKTIILDEYNKPTAEFQYRGIFPVSLSEVRLSHQDPSELSCTAQFAYFQLYGSLIRDIDKGDCT